jgi:hypothetical protein
MTVCGGDRAGQGAIQGGENRSDVRWNRLLSISVSDALGRKIDRSIRLGRNVERESSLDVLLKRAEIMR